MGLTQGLFATQLRDIPAYGFMFGFYELSKTMMLQPGEDKKNLDSSRVRDYSKI